MTKTLGITAILVTLGTSLAFGQANPNQGAVTGTQSNTQQMEQSVTGNPNNPGPRGQ